MSMRKSCDICGVEEDSDLKMTKTIKVRVRDGSMAHKTIDCCIWCIFLNKIGELSSNMKYSDIKETNDKERREALLEDMIGEEGLAKLNSKGRKKRGKGA